MPQHNRRPQQITAPIAKVSGHGPVTQKQLFIVHLTQAAADAMMLELRQRIDAGATIDAGRFAFSDGRVIETQTPV
jgi:hypothetical protein